MGASALIALGVAGLTATVPAAEAGTCTSKTGGSSNWLMYTGNNSAPYTCAYNDSNGDTEIPALGIQSWTSSTAKGYEKDTYCDQQTGGVTLSYIYADSASTGVGSSITFTASNSQTSDRHWNAAVLWYTPQGGTPAGDQYDNSCDDYQVEANLYHLAKVAFSNPPTKITFGSSGSFTVDITAPDGGTPAGTVAMFQQVGSSQDPSGKNCSLESNGGRDPAFASATVGSNGVATIHTPAQLPAGVYKMYAAYGGSPTSGLGAPNHCMTPPTSGLTPAVTPTISVQVGNSTSPAPPLATGGGGTCTNGVCVSSTAVQVDGAAPDGASLGGAITVPAPAGPTADLLVRANDVRAPRQLKLQCPAGQEVLHTELGSTNRDISQLAVRSRAAAVSIDTESLPEGTEVRGQVLCRPEGAEAASAQGMFYGSAGGDRFVIHGRKGIAMSGRGDDHLMLKARNAVAFAGVGDDRVMVSRAASADGGPGSDRLVGTHRGALLVGGPGRDRFIANRGGVAANARDGAGRDTVICRGATTVIADPGDRLIGRCNTVTGLG